MLAAALMGSWLLLFDGLAIGDFQDQSACVAAAKQALIELDSEIAKVGKPGLQIQRSELVCVETGENT